VPTMIESGYPNVLADSWYGILAPVGTPPAIIARMNTEINALLALPDVRDAMEKQGVQPVGGAPEKLDVLLRHELKLWSDVVVRGKITAE
jgi:tripartite-type tricarboxylate transporter receptor subunit TctC